MSIEAHERLVERGLSYDINKLVFVNGGQVANDGWWTLRQDPKSSNFATKVKCTEWGHVVMVGDIVDIVFRGSQMDGVEAIKWVASSDLTYLASKCQIEGQAYEYSRQVAVDTIRWHIDAGEESFDRIYVLRQVLRMIDRDGGDSFPREAEELWYGELQMESCPGEVPSVDVIAARLVARRMLKLWDSEETKS